MGTFANLEDAVNFFNADKFAAENGIKLVELGEDSCVATMPLRPEHINASGGVMGGVIFTLADFAFAVVANNIHKPSIGQQNSITFLNSPKGTLFTAKAKCRKTGRTVTIINVDVTDDTGRDIAQFTGTSFKL